MNHTAKMIKKLAEQRVDLWETCFFYNDKKVSLPLKVETGIRVDEATSKEILKFHVWAAEKVEAFKTAEEFHQKYCPHFTKERAEELFYSCKNVEIKLKELFEEEYEKIKENNNI